jgi:D-sedoheptulose 7-phosphate isomerase
MVGENTVLESIEDSLACIGGLREEVGPIAAVCDVVIDALKSGRKILTAGNGGSAAEALHMAEELVGRFRGDRLSLPAVSLVADCTALTCIGNDYGFDCIFSRQVEGLGQAGDVLVVFSTSGNSRNLVLAVEAAKSRGVVSVALLGRDGGALSGVADHEIVVAGSATEHIQEAHQVLLHIILNEVESVFFTQEEL